MIASVYSGETVQRQCRVCQQVKEAYHFNKNTQAPDGLSSWCRECRLIHNKSPNTKGYLRARILRKDYGVTPVWYLAQAHFQDGRCAVCKQPGLALCVDHRHDTGKVRGLICTPCNLIVGSTHDRIILLQSAISYIETYK